MLFLSSRICHAGECDDSNCTQPCKEPRLNCGHPCNAPCHDGKFCTLYNFGGKEIFVFSRENSFFIFISMNIILKLSDVFY